MQVGEIMATAVVTVGPDCEAKEAFELMRRSGFRHLPVVNESGRLIGVVSDRDLRNVTVLFDRRPKSAEDYMVVGSAPIGSMMAKDPLSVAPDTLLSKAISIMVGEGLSCLPVLDAGDLVGILTASDLLGLLSRFLERPRESSTETVPE